MAHEETVRRFRWGRYSAKRGRTSPLGANLVEPLRSSIALERGQLVCGQSARGREGNIVGENLVGEREDFLPRNQRLLLTARRERRGENLCRLGEKAEPDEGVIVIQGRLHRPIFREVRGELFLVIVGFGGDVGGA
jgi:hypothetical protein